MTTLGEELPRQMARVTEVLVEYGRLGVLGQPAATLMRRDLELAARALAEQDVAAMIVALDALRGWSS